MAEQVRTYVLLFIIRKKHSYTKYFELNKGISFSARAALLIQAWGCSSCIELSSLQLEQPKSTQSTTPEEGDWPPSVSHTFCLRTQQLSKVFLRRRGTFTHALDIDRVPLISTRAKMIVSNASPTTQEWHQYEHRTHTSIKTTRS